MPNPLTLRLIEDIKKLELRFPVAEISRATGFKESNISAFLNGKRDASDAFLKKFYSKYYPESGVTENMLTYKDREEDELLQEPDTYLQIRRKQKAQTSIFLVTMVPVKAQAGYVRSYNNTDYINELDTYPIVPGIDPRGTTWRYFEVEGDSMTDTLGPRDIVLCNFVPDFDWMEIKDNHVFVLITKNDGVLIKRVKKMTTDRWMLKSDNKQYKDKPIEVSEIIEVWRARRSIGGDLGPTKKTKHYELD